MSGRNNNDNAVSQYEKMDFGPEEVVAKRHVISLKPEL